MLSSVHTRLAALAVAFMAVSLLLASTAGARPAPPAGVPVLSEGQLPRHCTASDTRLDGVYYESLVNQWVTAPNCVARWGFLEASGSQLARAGDAVTVVAIPADGSNSGTYAPETGSITWEVPGKPEKGSCRNVDLTCRFVPAVNNDTPRTTWQWFEVHVSMPRTFFIDSPGDLCGGQHLCAGATTNAWSWVGVPPPVCKKRPAGSRGAWAANSRSAASRYTLGCWSAIFGASGAIDAGTGWMLEALGFTSAELGPEAPLIARYGGKALQAFGFGEALVAGSLLTLSFDPPDPAFRKIAKPDATKPDLLTATGPLSTKLAPPLNALAKATIKVGALARALETSRDRAGGAAKARSKLWERRQMLAVASYAGQLVTALKTLSSAQRTAAAALRQTELANVEIPLDQIAAFTASVKRDGLPAELKSRLREDGLSSSDVQALAKQLLSAGNGSLRAGLDEALSDPRTIEVNAQAASFLAAYAKRVAANPSTKTN